MEKFFGKTKIPCFFSARLKGGKKVIVSFRFPRLADAKAMLSFINRVRGEAEFLGQRKKESLSSEKKFLASALRQMHAGNRVFVLAESGGKIVGNASISRNNADSRKHTGEFGIALLEEFTSAGIGSRLGALVLSLAKNKMGLKIVVSFFFSKNKRSRALHKKLGFKKFGELPQGQMLKDGSFCSEIFVSKNL